jgi:hypothetical protein
VGYFIQELKEVVDMKIIRTLILVVLVGSLAGCGSDTKRISQSPIEVDSEKNADANFAGYRTWMWMPNIDLDAVDYELKDPQVKFEIGSAVEGELFEKGYAKVTEKADLIINAMVLVQDITHDYIAETYGGSYTPEYRKEAAEKGEAKQEWTEGSLVLLFYDGKTAQLMWQTSAKAEVSVEMPPKDRQKRINKLVKMMLEQFPKKS